MNLRLRTLTIVVLTLLALFSLLYLASSKILLEGFARLEEREMGNEITRAREALRSHLDALATTGRDWAFWDDTYAYLAGRDPNYRETNLVAGTFTNLDLDLLFFLRPDGSALFAGGFDIGSGEVVTAPSIADRLPLSELARQGSKVLTGIVTVNDQPLLVAVAPVLSSAMTGPSRGFLVMGRYLTPARLERIAAVAHLSLTLLPRERLDPAGGSGYRIDDNAEDILGELPLLDLAGAPAAAIRVRSDRWIYRQGTISQQYLLANLAIAGLVVSLLVALLLERLVLARIAAFDRVAALIRREGNASMRLPVKGRDELDRLAGTINQALDALEESHRKRLHDALHDPLTGLGNRALFADRVEGAIGHAHRYGDRFAVLLVDLDHFKVVNDGLGHTAGDGLLLVVAQRLMGVLRAADTVARLGGDEFALLLTDVGDDAAPSRCAERILEALREPVAVGDQGIHISASIGIAVYADGPVTAEQMLRDADTAMYRAKQAGRSGFALFDEHMHAQVLTRLELENDLRLASERNELRVYYQPLVDLASGRVSDFEALVRWEHPRRGRIPPDAFIPLAENAGIIGLIDRWVLREACRCVKAWQERYPCDPPLAVSVNMSCEQTDLAAMGAHVRATLAATGLDSRCLRIEVTESALAVPEAELIDLLFELQALGVGLYLDDFGTGHSSLSRLHRLPIHALKIDRSFVQEMERGDTQIAAAVVTLAHSLGKKVVAEGIETTGQRDLLRQMGCEYGQGYLYAPPLAEEAAERYLAAALAEAATAQNAPDGE